MALPPKSAIWNAGNRVVPKSQIAIIRMTSCSTVSRAADAVLNWESVLTQQKRPSKSNIPPCTESTAEVNRNTSQTGGCSNVFLAPSGVNQNQVQWSGVTWHLLRIWPNICNRILRQRAKPSPTPTALIWMAVGSGPYWIPTTMQMERLIHFTLPTSAPDSPLYVCPCKQASNSNHAVKQLCICILDWRDERCGETFEYVLHRVVVHENLQDVARQSDSRKKSKCSSLEKGIIKRLTSITLCYICFSDVTRILIVTIQSVVLALEFAAW